MAMEKFKDMDEKLDNDYRLTVLKTEKR